MAEHALVSGQPSGLLVRLPPSPPLEHVGDTSPEFSEGLHRVHRMAKRFEARSAVIFQISFDCGWVRDVDLVRETLDVQESEYAVGIKC